MLLEEQNTLFLKVIIKNREDWKHNIEFSKIVEKMKKGKKLKQHESAKIHWFLWAKGH
jgi:hypothetical protein